MILDGNSIVNRAFFGVHQLNAPDGTPTNAIYGFINILQKLIDDNKPDRVCVAFDLKAPTFRHKAYSGYKAQRKGMPEELAVQLPILKEILDLMNINRYELEGFEADDILGTVSAICDKNSVECLIVTGDKDSLQLITGNTTVCNIKTRMGQTETIYYTPEVFKEEYGFGPAGIIDLKALMGDSSDNIPGVPGIGEKTAKELVAKFGSLEKLYNNSDSPEIRESVRKKLKAGKESAEMSYMLATIIKDAPVDFSFDELTYDGSFNPELYSRFKKLGFFKFIEKYSLSENITEGENVNGTEVKFDEVSVISSEDAALFRERINSAELISLSVLDNGDSFSVSDGATLFSCNWSECREYSELLKFIFSCETKKVVHGLKNIISFAINENIAYSGFCFDTELAAYLLDPLASGYPVNSLGMKYLGSCSSETADILRLYAPLKSALEENGLDKLYYNAELPLCEVLAEMEKNGFLVDKDALYSFGEMLNKEIKECQDKIFSYSEHEFNINSPKQLGTVLFDELYLPGGKKTKTGWSTGAEVLEKLSGKHPIISEILEYRTLTKLKSTYADGLLKVIGQDGRIHTNFQMTVTATGRLSSTEPNLQNIPIRKALGAEIRKMFIASPGYFLVDADYSQIELRILASMSGDENMKNAFLSGEDFHRVTASQVYGVPLEEVTDKMRSSAKAVNFGIVYGISAFSLSQDIGVTTQEAKAFMDRYFARFPGVQNYLDNVVKNAENNGYVSTVFGRRRPMPELKDSNFNMRAFGKRVAMNMPVQGTAADIIKLAMIKVYRRLKAEKLEARMLLQVHDELIIECPENEIDKVKEILACEMEKAAELSVPLRADTGSGSSWYEAH